MDHIEQTLASWRESLMTCIPIAGLRARNPVAYKWKALSRCWFLREAAFWRSTDLLTQSHLLHQQGHGLGARILLRSGFETLATLIHLNQLIQKVLDGSLDFHLFSRKTSVLLLGSRDGSTGHQSLNIMTILSKCDDRYPGLQQLYAILSECAHANYDGMLNGYSEVDHEAFETRFSNRWMQIYGAGHLGALNLCMSTFRYEYDVIWPGLTEVLESWVTENDATLEATKSALGP